MGIESANHFYKELTETANQEIVIRDALQSVIDPDKHYLIGDSLKDRVNKMKNALNFCPPLYISYFMRTLTYPDYCGDTFRSSRAMLWKSIEMT